MNDIVRLCRPDIYAMGERCGITIAHPEVIGILRRIMAPYSLTVSAIRVIAEVLTTDGIAYGRANIMRLLEERNRVHAPLTSLPTVLDVFPSDANFLLVRTTDARRVAAVMDEHGVRIRDRSGVVDNAVRISIGTPEENDRMLEAFASARPGRSPAVRGA